MKIDFLMRGDVLCSAVLLGNRAKVLEYLCKDYDVDAKCRTYGTDFQAAAVKGEEEIAFALIEDGANVNASGGRYNSALIAAVVYGHEELSRFLLRNKANVLAKGGQYINALYQAVSFQDICMGHLLLEKGAWLSDNYLEILDVAAEMGNRNMMRMLEDYDVLGLWNRKLPDQSSSETDRRLNSAMAYIPFDERRAVGKPRTLTLVRAVMMEALSLKGQRGKWTGIKAVRLLQTALRMGASESIIDQAAPLLSSYESLVQVICQAGKELTEEQQLLEGSDIDQARGQIQDPASSSRPRRRQEAV